MSDEATQNISGERSFEERVFARFDALDARLDGMEKRLTTLEERVERRLQETRPIWEQVLARLDTLETETRNGFRRLSREMKSLAKT